MTENSEFKLDDIKRINQKTKDIVNGYLRVCQQLLPYKENTFYVIPMLINNICTLYYKTYDEWDINAIGTDCILEKDRITIKNTSPSGGSISALLTNIISSDKYEWTKLIENIFFLTNIFLVVI